MPNERFNIDFVATLKDEASGKVGQLKVKLLDIGKAILPFYGISGAVYGIKAAFETTIRTAEQFESRMGDISTIVDTNIKSMSAMGDAVVEMSKRLPISAGELAKGLYDVRSAGVSAADAMGVLESAGRLAVAGLGTADEAVDLMTSAVNAFAGSGLTAYDAANILFKATKYGKLTVAELAQSFGMAAPLAATMGISLEELTSSVAALTTVGMPASEALTQVRSGMMALMKPTEEMESVFEKFNVETGIQFIEKSGGMVNAFIEIRKYAEVNGISLTDLISRVEGLNGILALTGSQLDTFKIALDDAESGEDSLTEAFSKQMETSEKMSQVLKNHLGAIMIEFGNKILPWLIKGFVALIETINETSILLKIGSSGMAEWILRAQKLGASIKGNEDEVKNLEGAIEILNEEQFNLWGEFNNVSDALDQLSKGVTLETELEQALSEASKQLKNSEEESTNELNKKKVATEAMSDAVKDLTGWYTNLQNRIWGFADEEISALQDVASARKEQMDMMEEGWKDTNVEFQKSHSLEYAENEREFLAAQRRIQEIKKEKIKTMPSAGAIIQEATGMRSQLGEMGGALGIPSTNPNIFDRIEMPETSSQKIFNFNFQGAFIGNKDEFTTEVINKINRMAEQKALGGK